MLAAALPSAASPAHDTRTSQPGRIGLIAYARTYVPEVANAGSYGGFDAIWLVNAGGSQRHRVLSAGGGKSSVSEPAWSPDGTKLAYTRFTGRTFELHIATAGGRPIRTVATGLDSYLGFRPTWSPRGDEIAVADGQAIQIFSTTTSARRTVPTPPGEVTDADWSSTERFVFSLRDPDSSVNIWTMNADGTGAAQLTSTPPDKNAPIQYLRPSWSPAGRRILFMRFDVPARILVMNADGTGVRQLARGDDPAWSPDGTRIVYDSGFASTISTIVVKPVAGGKAKVLARSQRQDGSDHVWQPDWQPCPRGRCARG